MIGNVLMYLHGHIHRDLCMWLVAIDLKVFKLKIVNVFDCPGDGERWKWAWCSLQLEQGGQKHISN